MKLFVLSLFLTCALCAVVPQNDELDLGNRKSESPEEALDQSRKAERQEVDPAGDVGKPDGIPDSEMHDVLDLSDTETVSVGLEAQSTGDLSSSQLRKREISPMVTMGAPMLGSRFGGDDNDNDNESEPRYLHTLAAIKPGKHLDLICRLLGIKEKDDIEKVLLLAKSKTKIPPILVTTENIGDEENRLIDAMNKALDDAAEAKKKLNPNEIDNVVEEFLDKMRAEQQQQTQQQSPMMESRLGAEEPEELENIEPEPEAKPKKSLVETIKERLSSRMPNLKLNKFQKTETPQFVDGPIVQPQATLDYDDNDNDQDVGGPRTIERNNFNINNPEQALQNLKDQVSSAQNNQDLETAKSLLERIQKMVSEIESNRESEETKRKLSLIEDTLKSPNNEEVGAAPEMDNRVGEAPIEAQPEVPNVPTAMEEPNRVKIAVQELKKFPQAVIDTAQKALHSVDENNLGQLMSPSKTLSDAANLAQKPTLASRLASNKIAQPTFVKPETIVGAAQQKPLSLLGSRFAKPSLGTMQKPGLLGSIIKPVLGKTNEAKNQPILGARMSETSDKNAIESGKKPDLFENLKTKLKSAKPAIELKKPIFSKAVSSAEKPTTTSETSGSDILQMIKKNTDEAIQKQAEILKKTHEENMQKQADLMKKHEESRQNILKSIKEKISTLPDLTKPKSMNQIKPSTPGSVPAEKTSFVSSPPVIQPQEEVPEINQRNNFEDSTLGSANPEGDKKADSEVYFVGDGVKLPLKMMPGDEGSVHLSVDMDKLCSCGNVTCPKKRDIAAVLGTILEKEAELKDELDTTSHHGISAKVARSTDKLIKELENAGFEVEQRIVMLPKENVTVPIFKDIEKAGDVVTDNPKNQIGKVPYEDNTNDYVTPVKPNGPKIEQVSWEDLMKQTSSEEQKSGFNKDEKNLLNILLEAETTDAAKLKNKKIIIEPLPLRKIMEEVKKHDQKKENIDAVPPSTEKIVETSTGLPSQDVLIATTEKYIPIVTQKVTKTEEKKNPTEIPPESTTIVKRMADFSVFDTQKDKLSVPNDVSKFSEKYDDKLKVKPYKVAKLEKELNHVQNELKAEVGDSLMKTEKLVENGAINVLQNHDKNVQKDLSLMGNILSFMKGFANDT
ncbi:unnamed protein product [Brassicogethes aeneus]|uniref:Uncharacterized protein n=1 Tax=Brassicogethes aeneus TaxID=1431903 RepID=A0A9P0FJB0_BRAAE|nr:unnamed protein product [Brassicogethes aeneus]